MGEEMTMRDILLQANSYPEPTPDWAIERSIELAKSLGAELTLGVCQVHLPPMSNWLANKLLDMDGMLAGENHKSHENQKAITERFLSLVPPEWRGDSMVIQCPGTVTHWQLAVTARTHDLTIVPAYGHAQTASVAEGLVFESGRPVLLLPETGGSSLGFDRIAIAWDGSRVAARAIADALPLCAQAQSVALVQISGEKDLSNAAPLAAAIRNLALHGIAAERVEVELEERDVAKTLQSYCSRDGRELLVMGAFGHSRAREFVLGGVTRSILDGPLLPTFISH